MSDFLAYRIPGEMQVSRTGCLKELIPTDELEGFVFSDFTGERRFGFVENEVIFDKWHLHGNIPEIISKEEYLRQAQELIQQMKKGEVEKIVYSRVKSVPIREQNLNELFIKLSDAFPNAFVYLLSSKSMGTWIGASPEIILTRKHNQAITVALAGTKPISDASPWTTKERREHSFVSEHIERILNDIFHIQPNKKGPFEVEAGPVKHLKTNIDFDLSKEQEKSFLSFVHPTPAISGAPVSKAVSILSETERHERNLYGGFFGLFEQNETCCYVNLRCCRIIGDHAFLYIGGGITAESDAFAEWEETEYKSLTLSSFIS
jgi:isochorismate synthase